MLSIRYYRCKIIFIEVRKSLIVFNTSEYLKNGATDTEQENIKSEGQIEIKNYVQKLYYSLAKITVINQCLLKQRHNSNTKN